MVNMYAELWRTRIYRSIDKKLYDNKTEKGYNSSL